jgi:peptidoglycan/LPS O-acetylase OafA/YrhL
VPCLRGAWFHSVGGSRYLQTDVAEILFRRNPLPPRRRIADLWPGRVAKGSSHSISGSRSLLLLGNASFAFYLVHLPIIRIGKAVLLMVHREIVSWPAILVAALILYVLAQTAAIGIFKYFEIPVQTFLRGVFRGRHRNHLQPTSAARN